MDPIQIAIVVIIMVVGAVRWFIENVIQKGQPRDEDERPGGTLEDLYEEARREILERQGRMSPETEARPEQAPAAPPDFQPREQVAPPPLPPQATEYTPPPKARTPATVDGPFEARQVVRPKLSAEEKAALSRMQKRQEMISARRKTRGGKSSTFRDLLATPQATRNAILLREILGPPKGYAE